MFVCGTSRRSAVVHRERGGEGESEDDVRGLERRQDVPRRKGGQREKRDCHGVWWIHYLVALDNSIRDDSQGVSLHFYRKPYAVIEWVWRVWACLWFFRPNDHRRNPQAVAEMFCVVTDLCCFSIIQKSYYVVWIMCEYLRAVVILSKNPDTCGHTHDICSLPPPSA